MLSLAVIPGQAASERAATVLVVDDDAKLGELVAEYLGNEGFRVEVEGDGERAVARILSKQPDVVVLDAMLPGTDGFDVCRRVRDRFPGRIVMLTARGEEIDEVLGLELGADDYLAKPVRPRVLLTRIRSLLRRSPAGGGGAGSQAAAAQQAAAVTSGGLCVDPASRRATADGVELDLTTGEFDLLYFLASHRGETVTRDAIYRGTRGIEYDGLDRSVDLCVARLRKKLGDDGRRPRWIKSVRGVGYHFVADL